MTTQEAWLLGGPAGGRIMTVERNVEGRLPTVLTLDQAGLFVETSDVPAPHTVHRYARAKDKDVDGLATYRYVGPDRGAYPL
jgi:hypothetical protein